MQADSKEVITLLQSLSSITEDVALHPENFTDARSEIITKAERIVIAARGGGENLYRIANNCVQEAAVRCAIGLDVFTLIPSDGSSVTAATIAKEKGADVQLVARIMRGLTSTHIFDEVSEQTYAHNTYSKAFVSQNHRDLYKTIYDTAWKACYALPEYFEKFGWNNSEDYDACAFQFGYQTKNGMWEWMQEDPERMKTFNSGMQSNANVSMQQEFPFPFVEKLNKDPITEDEVVLVDVGGGRGQTLMRLKAAFPDLQGRLVLQDQEPVVADAVANGLPDYIEPLGQSFFEPCPIKGARAYYFRRVFHDWSDKASLQILKNVACSMAPGSRILISDNVMPDTGAHWSAALPDLRMMAIIAGMERTRKQWISLLTTGGFENIRFWQASGSYFGMVEATLSSKGTPDAEHMANGSS